MNKKSKNRQAKNQQNPDKIPEFAFKFSNLFSKNYQIITTILLLFPLVIYGQVWNFEFVWDDFQRAGTGHLHNPFVKNPSFSNFFQLFSQPYFGMYIPITYLFWGGLKAFAEFFSLPVSGVLHFTNVIIHIVNGLLVFTILKNFISNKWAVLLGTLFFLLHPIQVETVAFISEFRNLLAFCFSLSGLYFYLKNQARLDFLPLFLFILALLSKPSAAVLPLIIFAINHFHYQFKLKNNIKKVLPFALIALIIAIITYFSQANSVIFSQHISPVWQRPFAWLDSIIFYLAKIIYPNLSISYTLAPKFIATKFWFYPLAILPLGLGFWLWLKRKTQPLLALSSVLFVAGFFTTSGFIGFIFQRYSLVADRYLYFAMLGFALFIAVIFSKISNKIWQLVMIFALIIFAGISAFRQIPIWQNPLKLWSHAVHYEIQPQYAYANLGGYFNEKGTKFYQNGKFQKSIIYFDKALKLYPKYSLEKLSGTKYNKGLSLLALKNPQKALDNFTQALGFNPKNANANNIKIHILTKSKQCQKAQAALVLAKNNNVEIRPEVLKNIKQCVKK